MDIFAYSGFRLQIHKRFRCVFSRADKGSLESIVVYQYMQIAIQEFIYVGKMCN
jgi:hypothetical protein